VIDFPIRCPAGHARNVDKPGERPAALTPDGWEQAATQRNQEADLRDRIANERDATADLRDRIADQRDATADQRDATADQRDATADLRDATADQRDATADLRDAKADKRDREVLSESATARLQARLETMPVIEQAKGVIMHQNRCTEEQAFDLLRKASQRSNVPVRELAARIVASYQPQAPEPPSPEAPASRPRSQRSAP
jgi:ANTAR domain-containing protein